MSKETAAIIDRADKIIDRIAEAREMGFKAGVDCQVPGGTRTMRTDRMKQTGDNVLVLGSPPFYIRQFGRWVAEPKMRRVTRYVD